MDRAHARERLGLPGDGVLVGWVGRLSREKAPDVLLEALGLMGADPPLTAFVGDGREAAALKARTAALGLEGKVRWTGLVDGAARLLPAFDAFVLSSRTEGTPIVLLEAMAAGVPVIVTRVGGVPDVVSDAEAVLVPSEDPAALAGALRSVLADAVGSARRSAAAQGRLARDFAEGPWLDRYEVLYRGLIEAGRRAWI
jgi:glycosyltransferase involved in cell wall biosynthesis